MSIVIRQATLSDAAPIWTIRYAVRENTLTTGRHSRATVFHERLGWRRVGVPGNGEARYELPDAG